MRNRLFIFASAATQSTALLPAAASADSSSEKAQQAARALFAQVTDR